MRKALVIGIDNYPNAALTTCVNDAICVGDLLSKNVDESKNFDVKYLLDQNATRAGVRESVKDLFKNENEVALLYFSGHGSDDDNDGFVCTHDWRPYDLGISMPEIIQFVNKSKCKNKIVIFDCCYSGAMGGASGIIGDQSVLSEGTIILTASRRNEPAVIRHGEPNSLFTRLFVQGLEGAASDIFGETTPSGIYAFIDKALGSWEQRPFFKSNVSSFISLRKNEAIISLQFLKSIMTRFIERDSLYKLNPSYEPTNIKNGKNRFCEPYAVSTNCEIFKALLMGYKAGIIVPSEKENMYETAMSFSTCQLTKLGQFYFDLVRENKI